MFEVHSIDHASVIPVTRLCGLRLEGQVWVQAYRLIPGGWNLQAPEKQHNTRGEYINCVCLRPELCARRISTELLMGTPNDGMKLQSGPGLPPNAMSYTT